VYSCICLKDLHAGFIFDLFIRISFFNSSC